MLISKFNFFPSYRKGRLQSWERHTPCLITVSFQAAERELLIGIQMEPQQRREVHLSKAAGSASADNDKA